MFDRLKKAIFRIIPPSRRFMDRKFRESDASLIQNLENNNCLVNNVYNMSKEQLDHINIKVDEEYEILKNIYFDRIREKKDINILRDDLIGLYNLADKKLDEILREIYQNKCNHDIFWQNNTELINAFQDKNIELISAFHEKNIELIDNLQKTINCIIDDHKIISNKIQENLSGCAVEIADLPESIEKKVKNIEKNNISLIVNEINKANKHYYYSNDYERRILENFYELYDNEPKFTEAFTNLIRGMERDSVDKITEIISRQKQIRGTNGKALDIYTQDEQNKINEMKRYVQSHTLQIGKDLYCYEHFLLPVNHIETSVFYYKHGIQELKHLEKINGKDIIDVGGYIGDSVLILEELSPKTIYTFEASIENFNLLKRTLELNEISNCVAENKALGDKKGTCNLNTKGSQSNLGTIDYVTYEGQEIVEVDTLDNYVSEHLLNIGLIKVDIEGAEQLFLYGAKNTICEQKPTLLLSIYHNPDDFFGIKPLIESWNLGYKFIIHKPLDISVSREVLLICECD